MLSRRVSTSFAKIVPHRFFSQLLLSPPTIDLSRSPDKLLPQLADACEQWGFFQVVNHGIPEDTTRTFVESTKSFFHLPRPIRQACKRQQNNSRGWYDDELTKQIRDWKQGLDFGAPLEASAGNPGPDGWNQWPIELVLPNFRTIQENYFLLLEGLAQRLMELIALTLGAPPTLFQQHFVGHTSFLRLNHYPVCPDPSSHMAVNYHTDAGALTVLYQENVPALQVQKDDKWYLIPPLPGAFVVNIGDMMQVWTNNKYRAPVHRVLANQKHERVSTPFFYNPSYAANISPLASCTDGKNLPAYRTINWAEFRQQRFAGDYADLGEEVQISNYAITR